MLHFDLVYLARLHCASHQMNWAVTWCLRFSSLHSQAYFLLWGVLAKPDWTEAWTSQKAEPPSCSVAQLKAIVGLCFSFCCCSVCLCIWQQNCHLLFCTRLCLWESCYRVSGCCATVNECVCVCGCRVVANPAPTYTNYFMFFLKSSCFSWFALCSPKQGFVISRSVNDVRYDEYHCSLISLTLWLVRWEDIFSTKIWLPKYPCPALAFCNFLTL